MFFLLQERASPAVFASSASLAPLTGRARCLQPKIWRERKREKHMRRAVLNSVLKIEIEFLERTAGC